MQTANAQPNPIMITLSSTMDKVTFDGIWSHKTEWKNSSLDELSYDDWTIYLRTAHQDNFIYVFIDAVSDVHLNKGADKAIICFDTQNDKSSLPDSDDYCFMATLDGKRSFSYQGETSLGQSNLKKIANPDGFIGISDVSNENDRYTTVPHPSYEFRIPTSFVGRSDIYGFYLGVYDANLNKVYSWPENALTDNLLHVPSPNTWGELVSPDKSLPEFHLPLIVFLSAVFLSLYFGRINQTRLGRQVKTK